MLKDTNHWYHGTIDIYAESFKTNGVQVRYSKSLRSKDFGLGFYLTTSRTEAEIWAKEKAEKYNQISRNHHTKPMILEFAIKHSWKQLRTVYHLQDFQDVYSISWFDFVLLNRQQVITPLQIVSVHNYDVVYGLIADGKANEMMKIFSDQNSIDADFKAKRTMIDQLKMPYQMGYQNQLCICSQKFADSELLVL